MKLVLHIPNPILRQYLAFTSDKNEEGVVLSSRSATGALVCSLLVRSLLPQTERASDSVVVSVPIINLTMPFRSSFIALAPNDELAVNMVLKREFDLTFIQFMTEGLQAGRKRKELIEQFIDWCDLRDIDTAFDTLAKKHYRAKRRALRLFL